METIKNVNQLFIVEKQTPTADLEGDVISDYSDLKDGEVAVCNHLNTVLDGASGGASLSFAGVNAFKLIGRVGTRLIHSDLVHKGTIKRWSVTGQSAEVQQVDYVGYNGVSGAIDATASNLFTIRLYVRESTIQGFMQQKIKEGFYKSASSTTQQAIALGLHKSLVANYSREPEQDLTFERINSGAQADALATATVSVIKGSDKIVASEDLTALITAGTILRFGTTGAGTAPCYVVTGHNSGAGAARVYTLDMPWQGATNSAFAAASFESVTEGNWGIKISGVQRGFQAGFRNPEPITWKTTIDFGSGASAVVTESTSAYPGIGTAQQVAKLEKELQADNHVYRSMADSGVVDRKQVTDALLASGELYDMCVLEYYGWVDNGLGVKVKSPKTITIAGENSTNLSMSDANQGVVQTIDEIVQVWAEEGFTSDQDANLT